MYKNKYNNRNNICGTNLKALRGLHNPPLSQKALADRLQLQGLDLDKNAIQRIESGQRFITDIELKALASFFNIPFEKLYAVEEG